MNSNSSCQTMRFFTLKVRNQVPGSSIMLAEQLIMYLHIWRFTTEGSLLIDFLVHRFLQLLLPAVKTFFFHFIFPSRRVFFLRKRYK